jgi:hypothetical protein
VEIVCGEGPWERHEAAVGAIERATPMALADLLGPIIGPAVVSTLPTGEQLLSVRIDERHFYLGQHRIDGVPVLPAGGGAVDHGRRGTHPVAGMEGCWSARTSASSRASR